MEVRRVAVIGAGTMGHGIAELFAMNGFEVVVTDVAREILDRAMSRIRASLEKLAAKGTLREPVDAVMARISTVVNDVAAAAKGADLVIEAIIEDLEAKKKVFAEADRAAPSHAILATNTSSLPITEIAEAVSPERRPRVVGMHFFNPPVILPLVEVVRGAHTSDETVRTIVDVARRLGKTPVVGNRDVPGFIVNRIMVRLLNEACWEVARGRASIAEVDAALRSLGLPMGALILADYVGLDVLSSIIDALARRGTQIAKCPTFDVLVGAGKLGVKSGEGFYKWPEPGKYEPPKLPETWSVDVVRLMAPAINEAAWLAREGIANVGDIDTAVKLGLNWPRGVFEYADEFGIDKVVAALERLKAETGRPEYEPDPLLRQMVAEGRLGKSVGRGFHEYGLEERDLGVVKVRVEPPIAWIRLSRPDRLNALNDEVLDRLVEALRYVDSLPWDRARVVVIYGEGKAFSAGADVSQFPSLDPLTAMRLSRKIHETASAIENLSRPVICAIHGYALGGGLELALACDIRIATRSAQLGLPEVTIGIFPGGGGTQRLARVVGLGRALELVLTGRRVSGEEAERIGLVNRAVPDDKLLDEARALANELAQRPPIALAMAKKLVRMSLDAPIDAGLFAEAAAFGVIFSTEDAKEGARAFLEKRRAEYRGR